MLNPEVDKFVETAEVVIVGGGVIGLAIARALSRVEAGRVVLKATDSTKREGGNPNTGSRLPAFLNPSRGYSSALCAL
jgi:glycine/D-amino acid oxidase-like deaminating enzyme